jgi:hypothetical protein
VLRIRLFGVEVEDILHAGDVLAGLSGDAIIGVPSEYPETAA